MSAGLHVILVTEMAVLKKISVSFSLPSFSYMETHKAHTGIEADLTFSGDVQFCVLASLLGGKKKAQKNV
jgi:hypothetical protein